MMLSYFAAEMATATHYTRAEGTYVKGEWVPGEETSASIRIVVPQPVKWDELSPSEQGEGVDGWAKTWTEAAVKTRQAGADPDVIEYGGERFLVVTAEPWPQGGFRRVFMRRTNVR